jgi:hypothetical protein
MAIGIDELIRWAESLPDSAEVAIDEGGLVLVEVDGEAYLEIGGTPQEGEYGSAHTRP